MKKLYDYRGFRFSRLREPRFSHILLLISWPVYLLMYYITENYIPYESCHIVHCRLDDLIPFCEYFALAYCFWYVYLAGSLLYYFLFDVENFKKMQTYIIITQIVAMACYIIYPTRQELRPDAFVRDNFFTHVMAFIYDFDTSTGICPSLHVAYSLGIASTWLHDKEMPVWWKVFVSAAALAICVSVCFVKQHSAVDVIAAIPVCILAEYLIFGKRITERKKNLPAGSET